MCYDFYDNKKGFEDGYGGMKGPMDCPYERKDEIIMWTMGFKDGRAKYDLENRTKRYGEAISQVNDSTHKQALVLRKDIKMPPGKAIAQGAHASLSAAWSVAEDDPRLAPWKNGRFTKTALKVDSESELLDIYQAAKDAGMIATLIQDSGFTVFNGVPTYTAIAVGPDTIENVNKVCGHLKLY